MSKKRIIYIVGAGRSGTTLLEIILGNAENILNAGELNRYPYRHGIARERKPGSLSYEFWNEIKRTLELKYDLEEQERLHKKFEYHDSFIKRLLGIRPKDEEFRKYRAFLFDLYDLIFSKTSCSIITDSSKYPGRAVNLSWDVPFEVSYIYIRRDPVDVVRSFAKKDIEQSPKGWLPANLYYFSVNLLCKLAVWKLRKKNKVAVLKYEDVLKKPIEAISNLEATLHIDLQKLKNKLDKDEFLEVCPYIFDANRIRLKDKLKIQQIKKEADLNLSDQATRVLNLFLYH